MPSLQDEYAPNSTCFGCGPKNRKGLRIKSRREGEEVITDWRPERHHASFPGAVSGGIISTLLDCHGNWAAACSLMKEGGLHAPPGTVTSELSIKFLRPTPMEGLLRIRAKTVMVDRNRAEVEGTIVADGEVTASMRGLFVAVKKGHPAYARWR